MISIMKELPTTSVATIILLCVQLFPISAIAQTTKSGDYDAFCRYYPQHHPCPEIEAYENAKRKNDFTAFCHNHPHHSQCQCGIFIGDTVTFQDPAEIYKLLPNDLVVKDEFETTTAFEKRVADAEAIFNEPTLLRGIYSREHTNYDADNSRIVMGQYGWGGSSLDSVFLNNLRVVVDSDKPPLKQAWKGEIHIGVYNEPAVLIPMPVEEAKRVISNLQVGILAKPKNHLR